MELLPADPPHAEDILRYSDGRINIRSFRIEVYRDTVEFRKFADLPAYFSFQTMLVPFGTADGDHKVLLCRLIIHDAVRKDPAVDKVLRVMNDTHVGGLAHEHCRVFPADVPVVQVIQIHARHDRLTAALYIHGHELRVIILVYFADRYIRIAVFRRHVIPDILRYIA